MNKKNVKRGFAPYLFLIVFVSFIAMFLYSMILFNRKKKKSIQDLEELSALFGGAYENKKEN